MKPVSGRWRSPGRCRAASHVRQQPGLGRVREERVREQDHRRAVADRDARRLDPGVEAVRRACRARSPAAATRRGGRRGPPAGRPPRSSWACPVEGPARCTSITTSGSSIATASPIVSAFRSMPGPLVAVTPSWPAKAAPERHVHRGDLVLGLDRAHAEPPVARQRVQQLGRRRDRVARVEEPEARLDAGGDQPVRERLGAVDVAVDAGRRGRGVDLVVTAISSAVSPKL